MYDYNAKCYNVVDGDTIDVAIDVGFHLTNRVRVRLLNIDTPEIFGRSNDKEFGHAVKDFVSSQLFDENGEAIPFVIHTKKTGSFGRWLGVLTFEDGETLTEKILKEYPTLEEVK